MDQNVLIKRQEEIKAILEAAGPGRENAIPSWKLQSMTGASDSDIRNAIRDLRRSGEDILSCIEYNPSGKGMPGFFYPATVEEYRDHMRHLYGRMQGIYKTVKGIERGIKKRFPSAQIPFNFAEIEQAERAGEDGL